MDAMGLDQTRVRTARTLRARLSRTGLVRRVRSFPQGDALLQDPGMVAICPGTYESTRLEILERAVCRELLGHD